MREKELNMPSDFSTEWITLNTSTKVLSIVFFRNDLFLQQYVI